MPAAETRALLRRWAEAVAPGRTGDLDALVAPDYRAYQPGFPGPVPREAHLQVAEAFLAPFPDSQVTVEDIIVEGGRGSSAGPSAAPTGAS